MRILLQELTSKSVVLIVEQIEWFFSVFCLNFFDHASIFWFVKCKALTKYIDNISERNLTFMYGHPCNQQVKFYEAKTSLLKFLGQKYATFLHVCFIKSGSVSVKIE